MWFNEVEALSSSKGTGWYFRLRKTELHNISGIGDLPTDRPAGHCHSNRYGISPETCNKCQPNFDHFNRKSLNIVLSKYQTTGPLARCHLFYVTNITKRKQLLSVWKGIVGGIRGSVLANKWSRLALIVNAQSRFSQITHWQCCHI